MMPNSKLVNWMNRFQVLDPIKIASIAEPYTLRPYLINTDPNAIPVTRIATLNDVYEAIGHIEQKVRPSLVTEFTYTAKETYRFVTAMAELCQNIYYHSAQRGNYHGYITMHADAHSLKFIAMDLGPGISFTLNKKYAFETDLDAIKLSLKPGITSRPHGGLGLYRTQQIVEQSEGHMIIRSGRAIMDINPAGVSTSEASLLDPMHRNIWGTQVGILLQKKSTQTGQTT
jgi:anti-sigma regulatory factor (Ser/Thr protein kinase)